MNITLATRPSPFRSAMLGLILAAPAALFLLANVLNDGLGIDFLYAPIVKRWRFSPLPLPRSAKCASHEPGVRRYLPLVTVVS